VVLPFLAQGDFGSISSDDLGVLGYLNIEKERIKK
jgi:hypothetical protein